MSSYIETLEEDNEKLREELCKLQTIIDENKKIEGFKYFFRINIDVEPVSPTFTLKFDADAVVEELPLTFFHIYNADFKTFSITIDFYYFVNKVQRMPYEIVRLEVINGKVETLRTGVNEYLNISFKSIIKMFKKQLKKYPWTQKTT